MSVYKIFVLNSKAVLKDAGGTILNIIGIKSLGTGTGNVSSNLIDWKMLQFTNTTGSWITNNPVLGIGEIAFTSNYLYTGTNQPRFKVGNGTDAWVDLDYVPEGSTPSIYPFDVVGDTVTLATNPTANAQYFLNGIKCKIGTGGSILTIVGTLITFDQDYTGSYFEAIY